MIYKSRNWVVVLLGLSALLLALLIPGGPIENRDFSHIHPLILGAFNIFLTVLNLGSIALIVVAIRRPGLARRWVGAVAILYFAVYAVDLAQLFPRSPTAMTQPLAMIEVLGMTVAVLLWLAARSLASGDESDSARIVGNRGRWIIAVTGLVIGTLIVVFATRSAIDSAVGPAVNSGSILLPSPGIERVTQS